MYEMIQKRRNLKNKKGFTLIELIVVIAILGILAAILIPQFAGFQDKARGSQVLVDAKQIATAADGVFAEKGSLPTTAEIVEVAGDDIVEANIDDLALTGGATPIQFTYEETVGPSTFTATRTSDGGITVEKN